MEVGRAVALPKEIIFLCRHFPSTKNPWLRAKVHFSRLSPRPGMGTIHDGRLGVAILTGNLFGEPGSRVAPSKAPRPAQR